MFQVVPFKAPHLAAIRLQAAQMYLSEWVTMEQGEALEQSPSVIPIWTGRAMAWSFISDTGPQHFLKCHRAVKHFLDGCFVQRIEMTVDCDHKEAHRWAKMLGFKMEAERMKAYAPDGHDCALYSRVL